MYRIVHFLTNLLCVFLLSALITVCTTKQSQNNLDHADTPAVPVHPIDTGIAGSNQIPLVNSLILTREDSMIIDNSQPISVDQKTEPGNGKTESAFTITKWIGGVRIYGQEPYKQQIIYGLKGIKFSRNSDLILVTDVHNANFMITPKNHIRDFKNSKACLNKDCDPLLAESTYIAIEQRTPGPNLHDRNDLLYEEVTKMTIKENKLIKTNPFTKPETIKEGQIETVKRNELKVRTAETNTKIRQNEIRQVKPANQ